MFDIAPTELMLVAIVALVVIGPKDLPRVMRLVGQWVGRARGMARHFRSGFDEMVRQAELDEMEKKWASENERIMREHPPHDTTGHGERAGDQSTAGQGVSGHDGWQAPTPVDAAANHAQDMEQGERGAVDRTGGVVMTPLPEGLAHRHSDEPPAAL